MLKYLPYSLLQSRFTAKCFPLPSVQVCHCILNSETHNQHARFLTKFAYVKSTRSKPSLPYLSTTFVWKCCWTRQKEAPILKIKRPSDVLWLSMQITFNSNIGLQLSRSRCPWSGTAKNRRKANVKHACNIKFLKMKNLIGSIAEDFHCFETSALSNQKMS